MTIIDNLIINSICLFLPISLYLNYLTYIKNIEVKEKSIILEFVIYASLILMMRYDINQNHYSIIIYTIPLLIALHKNNLKLYIILALTVFLFVQETSINEIYLLIKYSIYMIAYLISRKKKNLPINIYLIIESTFLFISSHQLSLENIITSILSILILTAITHLIIFFIKQGSKMVDLNQVLKELEHEKLLRSSISKLTHELKNPIAVCQGYLEMLNLKDKAKSEKYINIITNEITRSKTIIDEFSNYGKLKTIDPDDMDITYLLEDIQVMLTPLFKKNKATLSITDSDEIYIYGDYNKLKQVFINILKNTLEAKKDDTNLDVKIKIKNNKTKVTIKVIDNGIGMSEETLSRVSEVFFTTKSNGTGLGIAYSKEVIELHKGTLKISSTLNKGTEITITLPKEKKSEDFNKRNC